MDYEVVVCTYNGAKYIERQLDSILEQKPAPARVLVSDDGSTDKTRDIVRRIATKTDLPIQLTDGPRQGIVANVFSALPLTQAPYVFLADQDDVWLDNKAALFCEQMRAQNTPHLIFSDAWVWNPETDQRASFWALDGLDPSSAHQPQRLVFHNTVQGASCCINRALINELVHDDRIIMHDWWMALIASGLGEVTPINKPTLLYRQHADNQLGSQSEQQQSQQRDWSARKRALTQLLRQAMAFAAHYGHRLSGQDKHFFDSFARAFSDGLLQRIGFLLRFRPRHKTLKLTIALWVTILVTEHQE